MNENEVRESAKDLLSKLMELNHLATSQNQRRHYKDAKNYLENAIETGSKDQAKLGSYHLAVVSSHIKEVQEGKQKGERKNKKKT